MKRAKALLKIYCSDVLAGVRPDGCKNRLAELCGSEIASRISRYWEGKGMQNLKKEIEPLLPREFLRKGKLNREQTAAATIAFLENDYRFLFRGLNTYR